jgi:DNA-binding CsgD family transcriptional regulator
VRARLGDDAFAAAADAGRALAPEEAAAEAAAVGDRSSSGTPGARVVPEDVPPIGEAAAGLTAREVEVLRLLVDGRSNREIAGMLFISPRTASTHVGRILEKLGVGSRAAAASYARRHGLA